MVLVPMGGIRWRAGRGDWRCIDGIEFYVRRCVDHVEAALSADDTNLGERKKRVERGEDRREPSRGEARYRSVIEVVYEHGLYR